MGATKDSRLAVRMTAEAEAVIRAAADAEGVTVTDFMVSASTARALDSLADRRVFLLGDAAWTEFQGILDRPVQHKPVLETLFAEPSIFSDDV